VESFEPKVTKLHPGQEMPYKINQKGINQNRNKVELRSYALHFESLPVICIPSLESFVVLLRQVVIGHLMDNADRSVLY